MKFVVNREKILPSLQKIVSVIEKRQTMPILGNVLMQLEGNVLTMTGTDTEIQLVCKIQMDSASDGGELTVPARKFLDIIRLLPSNAEIKFETHDGDKVKLASGRSKFSLTTLPAGHYPSFSKSQSTYQFAVNAGKLKKAMDKTAFCMANQDVRFYLNGMSLTLSGSKITLVASDGHRLSFFEDDIGANTEHHARMILPRKAVQELARLLDDPDAEASIQASTNDVTVFYKDIVFSSKLIDAKFPDFSRAFDQPFMDAITLPRQALKEALTRVSILANEKFKGINFFIGAGSLKLTAHNPEHDEAEEELPIDYQGEPLTIAFNSQYMLDAVSNLDTDTAVITIAANMSNCFVEDVGQSLYKFVVMPMRV